MKMPKLTKPGSGWTKQLGKRVLLHANWSKSWDGWGRRIGDNQTIAYDTLAIQPFIAKSGVGLIIVVWKLRLQAAYVMDVQP
jgi:hypothetical protein